jgi:hypothetical protein
MLLAVSERQQLLNAIQLLHKDTASLSSYLTVMYLLSTANYMYPFYKTTCTNWPCFADDVAANLHSCAHVHPGPPHIHVLKATTLKSPLLYSCFWSPPLLCASRAWRLQPCSASTDSRKTSSAVESPHAIRSVLQFATCHREKVKSQKSKHKTNSEPGGKNQCLPQRAEERLLYLR